MTEPVKTEDAPQPYPTRDAADTSGERRGMRLTRRGWTVLLSMVVVLAFGLVGSLVPVPYVALGPGLTLDTLGKVDEAPVIKINGRKTYPTGGELRLTTVSVQDGMTLLGALGMWVSGRHALAPRELYYPPGKTDEDVKKENVQQFEDSQDAALVAAMRHLKSSRLDWADDINVAVVVKELTTGAAADKLLDPGDQLLKINGKQIREANDPRIALEKTKPGDKISVTYRDEGKYDQKDAKTGTITLGKPPDDRTSGFMGIEAGLHSDVKGLKVDITVADVGGPSAGLMFALAIVDRLTQGKLTDGKHIAGTGTITDDGRVGSIGGIGFKMSSAAEDGATVFLVPAGNCAEAAEEAPEGLRLVKVGTLDEAVTALEQLAAGKHPKGC